MTQSKLEVAERLARIRAEKLRENLARRKQQTRERAAESQGSTNPAPENSADDADKNPRG